MVPETLVELIQTQFALRLDGIHGVAHWARVRDYGLRLAQATNVSIQVVELFALLHDSKRRDDGLDPDHGQRAAEFVKTLRGSMIALPVPDFERLVFACAYHSNGLVEADITVQTCWDADRLDLGRIGIQPNPRYLCTEAARQLATIGWATRRSGIGYG